MKVVSAHAAIANIDDLIDEIVASHDLVRITGKRANAVVLSEDDWRAVNETLHLLSMPGLRESVQEGMATGVDECNEEPGW